MAVGWPALIERPPMKVRFRGERTPDRKGPESHVSVAKDIQARNLNGCNQSEADKYSSTNALMPAQAQASVSVERYSTGLRTTSRCSTADRDMPKSRVCIQPPQQGRAEIRDLAARRAARGSQPEGTSAGISAGSRLGGVALSIQAMTAPCR